MAAVKAAPRYAGSSNSSSGEVQKRAIIKKTDATSVNFGSMVKKLIHCKKSKNSNKPMAAENLMSNLNKGSGSGTIGLPKKLFKGSLAKMGDECPKKALSEVKSNTRTLAMVLRSERELLSLNKEQEELISHLKSLLQNKNTEVENLKDLCLKQKEDIKSLKTAVLFPDVMDSQMENLLEKQALELKQAKQLIPNLQRQVTSLTGQLQSLAQDLAEVKADRRGLFSASPKTPCYDQDKADYSSFDPEEEEYMTTVESSPDDMFIKDLNPCLTPLSKTNSKELKIYESPPMVSSPSQKITESWGEKRIDSRSRKLSKSSDPIKSSKNDKHLGRRSGDNSMCSNQGKQNHPIN